MDGHISHDITKIDFHFYFKTDFHFYFKSDIPVNNDTFSV